MTAVPTSVQPNPPTAAQKAAEFIAARLRQGVAERGIASVALSGGTTPALMFSELSTVQLPWPKIHLFQVDERVAPEGSDARNATTIHDKLLSKQPDIPIENWHPMPVLLSQLDQAADAYAGLVESVVNARLDVVHLGLGDDGHTASWPPGNTAVLESSALVSSVQGFRHYDRLTLTPKAINQSLAVVWLVTGASKREILIRWHATDTALPSSHVRRAEHDVLVVDADAWPNS